MTFPLLPIVSGNETIGKLAVTGKILVDASSIKPTKHALNIFPHFLDVFIGASKSDASLDTIVEFLNIGAKKVVVSKKQFDEASASGLPAARFIVEADEASQELLSSKASYAVTKPLESSAFQKYSSNGDKAVYYTGKVTPESAVDLAKAGYTLVVESSSLSTQQDASGKISVADVFTATLETDRPDGLYTTLVTTAAPENTALGVVYSSKASIKAAIADGEGVYQSRKRTHELWYKGKTSGATQKLLCLEKDCDNDVVKFVVQNRKGFGFCHNPSNNTCFHDEDLAQSTDSSGSGLSKLDSTLADRKENAPEGSYTKRLFNDDKLLLAKMKEELDELIEAGEKPNNKDEVAWEAADLLYFMMAYCVKNGVRLADIESNLDKKSLKVTRRKGDAKEKYIQQDTKDIKSEAKESEKGKNTSPAYKMLTIDTKNATEKEIEKALRRPVQKTADIMKLVLPIIKNVQANGDKALLELTSKFDGVDLKAPVLKAPFPEELMQISDEMKKAIDLSMDNIEKFHRAQLPAEEVMTVETAKGVFCSRFAKAIENVGLYVPGGTAVLPSTAMMLGVPAKVAGCKNIILASPPARSTGRLTPEVVYVAHKLGANAILMAGGAQAVTAMAYGTESVVKCDKILGPGNQFVTAAKMHVQNDTQALCSIDMPAGPSEVLVVADENADADFVASDLLSQAEHGVDSQVILIGVDLSQKKLAEFDEAVRRQAEALPRKDIVAKCLEHSFTLLVEGYEKAFELSNKYAPEHLILQIDHAESFVPSHIENAGSVFVGALSPESCGDYSSGTNHTLPTYGYARQYSGVNTATFQKFITAQNVTEEGLKSIGNAVMTLAAVEGLEAHRNAVQVRMDKLGLN